MFNTDLISGITLSAAAVVPIILSLTQIVKMTGWIQDKYAPFVSILFGILVSFLLAHDNTDLSANILAGILYGLAASGLYSGLTTTTSAIRAEKAEKARIERK